MLLNTLTGILQDLISDKRAMAMPPGGMGGAGKMGGGAKAGGGAGGKSGSQGGSTGGMMGSMPGMGGGNVDIQGALEAVKQKIESVKQRIMQLKADIDFKEQMGEDTSGLRKSISVLKGEESRLETDERKLKSALREQRIGGAVAQGKHPAMMIAGQVIQQRAGQDAAKIQKDVGAQESKAQTGVQKVQTQAATKAPGINIKGGGDSRSSVSKTVVKTGLMPGSEAAAGSGAGGAAAQVQIWKYIVIVIITGLALWLKAAVKAMPLIAFAPFIIIVLILVLSTVWHGKVAAILIFLLIMTAGYTGYAYTSPYVLSAFASGEAQAVAAEGAEKTSTGIRGIIEDTRRSWNKQMQVATGEYVEGETEQTTQYPIGIELLDPYYTTYGDKVTIAELDLFELNARLKGYDPINDVNVKVVCHVKEATVKAPVTAKRAGGLDRYPGAEQEAENVYPRLIEATAGKPFEEDITCTPKTSTYPAIIGENESEAGDFTQTTVMGDSLTCGSFIGTITAEVDGLVTGGWLENYIMSDDALRQEMKSLGNFDQQSPAFESAMRQLHPELQEYKSVSEEGPIKIVMDTQRSLVIGVAESKPLTFKFGVENMLDGWLRDIVYIEILLPEELEPVPGQCKNWDFSDGVLSPSQKTVETLDFDNVRKGEQKIFPTCRLNVKNPSDYVQPEHLKFVAAIQYNYVMQKKYNFQVTNETGGRTC